MKILVQKIDGNAQSILKCFCYNSTDYSLAAELKVDGFSGSALNEPSLFLKPGELKEFFSSFFHLMDHYPVISYSIIPYSTLGPEKTVSGQIKLKARDFTKTIFSAILKGPALSFSLESISIEKKSEAPKIEYKLKNKEGDFLKKVELYNTKELVHFNPTIDLHLHNLVEDVSKVKSGMALLIQLAAFERHLEKAIRLGVERIFVIHGVGEGKLKNAIIDAAGSNPMVKEVKNEYHPKFGFGSTEIIL